eukprot:scaffold501_cov407-Prasinococcus_capsulatus_cf.AAC.3
MDGPPEVGSWLTRSASAGRSAVVLLLRWPAPDPRPRVAPHVARLALTTPRPGTRAAPAKRASDGQGVRPAPAPVA